MRDLHVLLKKHLEYFNCVCTSLQIYLVKGINKLKLFIDSFKIAIFYLMLIKYSQINL